MVDFSRRIHFISDFLKVKEKVDEVHDMLAGTKFSVDYLLPLKSEELLSQTQRQERAISHIHDDLKETTSTRVYTEMNQCEVEVRVRVISQRLWMKFFRQIEVETT